MSNKGRGLAGQIVDDLQVLAAGMEDLEHVLVGDHQVEQGLQVDALGFGVDGRGLVRRGDLDEAQFGPEVFSRMNSVSTATKGAEDIRRRARRGRHRR